MELQILKKSTKKSTLKIKIKKFKKKLGKNNTGKIVIKHKGSGHKQKYRKINFKNINFKGIVYTIEYDPNRNCNIASIFNYKLNKFFYVLAPKNLTVGNIIKSGVESDKKIGHTMNLEKVPVGCCIHNVSFRPNSIAKIARAAGTYCTIIEKTKNFVTGLLNSGEKKKFSLKAFATIGIVSNELQFLNQIDKAGRTRWLGKRPTVRGVAKNPVDHPNGGGEGKKSGKRKNPWGKYIFSKR